MRHVAVQIILSYVLPVRLGMEVVVLVLSQHNLLAEEAGVVEAVEVAGVEVVFLMTLIIGPVLVNMVEAGVAGQPVQPVVVGEHKAVTMNVKIHHGGINPAILE